MRYRIRLNGTQDADLIALYRTGYPLGQAFADAARICLGNADIELPDTPPYPDGVPLDLSEVRISVTIQETSDGGQETIDALEAAEKGFRALIFRSCLRNALPEPYIQAFTGSALVTTKKKTDKETLGKIRDHRNDVPENVPTTATYVPDNISPEPPNENSIRPEATYRNNTEAPKMAAETESAGKNEDGVREAPNVHKSLFGGFVEEY